VACVGGNDAATFLAFLHPCMFEAIYVYLSSINIYWNLRPTAAAVIKQYICLYAHGLESKAQLRSLYLH